MSSNGWEENQDHTVLWSGTDEPETGVEEACMILLHPPDLIRHRRTTLRRDSYLAGRDIHCDLALDLSTISRLHAELVRDDQGHWWVQDRKSTNGTFVNERRVKRERLSDGDQIRFGEVIFKFLTGDNIESAYHEEIYRLAIQDGLTGVHNKRYLLDFLEREIAGALRHQQPLTLVIMDVDHFKRVNDQRGHLAGDAVLKEIARRIEPRMRREELFARYGGEEFAAVLTMTPLEGGIRFAEQLRRLVADEQFIFENARFPITMSFGVATMQDEQDITREALIKRADAQLYKAKHGGRNRVCPDLTKSE
ncbi:MAG: GGDEF domain-containing protein [Candidatus Krumholzibacteria bacterium]|nr:GGDEF domain-containing protein [Candidatus Krumholzibacteria bacterium]